MSREARLEPRKEGARALAGRLPTKERAGQMWGTYCGLAYGILLAPVFGR